MPFRSVLLAAVALALPLATPPAGAQTAAKADPAPDYARGGRLQAVAAFSDQQITGLAVSKDGRVFVNLPRWTLDVPVSVGEVVQGRITPYPDAGWNAWRNRQPLDPATHFVCVQSVVFDRQGHLWVLDPAAPGQAGPVGHGPKLVEIDIARNAVMRVLPFDDRAAPGGSYLNDVRFSPDGRWAYLTDSGAKGALVVMDLATGEARRVLDGAPQTQVDPTVTVHTDGRELRRPDGRQPQFAADGIALSADGATLYWQALTGRTLYSVPTSVLRDPAADAAAQVAVVQTTHPADGLWIDAAGGLYVTDPEHDTVEVGRPGGRLSPLVHDARLRWPDTFAQGGDGAIWFTTSHIQDSPWFKPQATTTPSEIWRIAPR